MGGGSGGSDKTTSTTTPWEGQMLPLLELYKGARNLELQQPYPEDTYVPFSQESLQAQEMQADRAQAGSPLLQQGQQAIQDTARGDYLFGAPELQNRLFEANARQIQPAISSAFTKSGRYGGGLHQESLARGLGDAYAQPFFDMYGKERGLQQSAAAMSPQMAAADYFDIGQLSQVGAQKEGKSREVLQSEMDRWNFQQQAPYQRLNAQSGVVQSGFPGGTSVSQAPKQQGMSPVGGALGGAASGAMVGSVVPGIGTAAGAAIGAAAGGIGASMK